MEQLLISIVKMQVVATIATLLYYCILRRSTFFLLNRIFLLMAMCLVFIAPLIVFTRTSYIAFIAGGAGQNTLQNVPVNRTVHIGPQTVVLYVYGIGVGIMLIMLLIKLISFMRMTFRSDKVLFHNKSIRKLYDDTAPFSFFNWTFINLHRYNTKELDMILYHESIHSRQLHSIDMLFAELVKIVCWCNPVIWLLPRLVYQNLEFITDSETVSFCKDKQHYQFTLLHLTHFEGNHRFLPNHFNSSPLKIRITMMNKQKTNGKFRLNYFVTALMLTATVLATGKLFAQSKTVIIAPATTKTSAVNVINENEDIITGPADDRLSKGKTKPVATLYQFDTLNVTDSSLATTKWNGDTLNITAPVHYGETVTISDADNEKVYKVKVVEPDKRKQSSDVNTDSHTPLIVINGVKQEKRAFSKIKPDNIKTLSVLKSRNAIAQYGEEARNGAILITTYE